jgi:hypothetical protein
LILNLSHIRCVEGVVEIHFVLLNVPEGITPGNLTYIYGIISPTKESGNVWHYSDYKSEGYYNVESASVDVDGTTVYLHNPGEYSGDYYCSDKPTHTHTPTETPSATATSTPTDTPTETPTPTPKFHDPFELVFTCTGFRIISHNDFESSFAWSIVDGPSGRGAVVAFGTVDVETGYYPGLVTLYSNGNLMAAGYLRTDCEQEKSPTPPLRTPRTPPPTFTRNPTEVYKTLVPRTSITPEILIPVTGVDLVSYNYSSMILFNLGIAFLGLGFIMTGVNRKPEKDEL